TGGLRGIGMAAVQRMLDEGAEVIIADLKASDDPAVVEALDALGQAASYAQLNVAEEAAWAACAQSIRTSHGRLDILVNNAGIDGTGPVQDMDFALWRRVMSVNLDGVFLGIKYCTNLMAETGAKTRGGASIINVSSILGFVGFADTAPYVASKGGVRLLTKGVAVEFASKSMPIRVNSLHPGFVKTPLLDEGFQNMVNMGMAEKAEDLVGLVAGSTPTGRLAESEEIAATIAFLASDDASYMTGSELVVDGGYLAR
ncbi:MAG: SDR family NAD(P)-dependent oxidoreductase, partial [Sphingopyxis sp.]